MRKIYLTKYADDLFTSKCALYPVLVATNHITDDPEAAFENFKLLIRKYFVQGKQNEV